MPRSSRSTTSRCSTALSERTRKRAASKQRSIYTIPQSPDGHDKEDKEYDDHETSSRASTAVPSPDGSRDRNDDNSRGRSLRDEEDLVRTPMNQPDMSSKVKTQAESRPSNYSIDALEAVTTLLDSARTSQVELERAKAANRDLRAQLGQLQADLRLEKDKVVELQRKSERDTQSWTQRDKDAGRELQELTDALKSFRGVASGIMPLLDVLAGAVDIRYDEPAERLWDLLKPEKSGGKSVKSGAASASTGTSASKKDSGSSEKNGGFGNKRETTVASLE